MQKESIIQKELIIKKNPRIGNGNEEKIMKLNSTLYLTHHSKNCNVIKK